VANQIVCVDNIGPGEVKKRLSFGIIAAVVAVVSAAVLLALGADRVFRGSVFVPASLAWLGYLQARQRT
jgi:uncharacterized membrane protein (UPF0136 family)